MIYGSLWSHQALGNTIRQCEGYGEDQTLEPVQTNLGISGPQNPESKSVANWDGNSKAGLISELETPALVVESRRKHPGENSQFWSANANKSACDLEKDSADGRNKDIQRQGDWQ